MFKTSYFPYLLYFHTHCPACTDHGFVLFGDKSTSKKAYDDDVFMVLRRNTGIFRRTVSVFLGNLHFIAFKCLAGYWQADLFVAVRKDEILLQYLYLVEIWKVDDVTPAHTVKIAGGRLGHLGNELLNLVQPH